MTQAVKTTNDAGDDNREAARKFMLEAGGARRLLWEIPGPNDTFVVSIQCWDCDRDSAGGFRTVIVEIYEDKVNGFDVFPCLCVFDETETKHALALMPELEKNAIGMAKKDRATSEGQP